VRYYFLGAYLPDLQRSDRKLRVDLASFLEERALMAPEDVADVDLVLLHHDVQLVENLLSGASREVPSTVHPAAFWREQLKKPQDCPPFLADLLAGRDPGSGFGPGEAGRLHGAYYDFAVAEATSGFLAEYLAFERDLRNVLAAVRARQLGLPVAPQLVGGGELVDALARSTLADFGLGRELPWLEGVLAADGPSQRQEVVERILWDRADDGAGADPFAFEALLAYLLKLDLLQSRLALSAEAGMAKIRQLEAR
jgi:hypothetical protein